jgi:hypothetical protein
MLIFLGFNGNRTMHDKICDIETAPDPEVIEKISTLFPFKPEDVNRDPRWKDETYERKVEEARASHLPKMLDKAQLNPALSFICSFGILPIDGDKPTLNICMSPEEETEGLEWIFDIMNSRTVPVRFIGYNFPDFDLEFMWRRAWIKGIRPPVRMRKGRYWNAEHVVDLMSEWNFNNKKNTWDSLDRVVKILGVECPTRPQGITGKDFWNLIRSEDPTEVSMGMSYGCADLLEERDVALRIL